MSDEQKQEDAARKRKIEAALKDGQTAKQVHLLTMSKLDEVLEAIKQDPEWQWPPSYIDYTERSIIWRTPPMGDVKVVIDPFCKLVAYSEEIDRFDTAKEALDRVDQLLRIRALPRVRDTFDYLHRLFEPEVCRVVWHHLHRWVAAFPDFRILVADKEQLCLLVGGQDHQVKVGKGNDNRINVFLSANMVNLLSFPKQ